MKRKVNQEEKKKKTTRKGRKNPLALTSHWRKGIQRKKEIKVNSRRQIDGNCLSVYHTGGYTKRRSKSAGYQLPSLKEMSWVLTALCFYQNNICVLSFYVSYFAATVHSMTRPSTYVKIIE